MNWLHKETEIFRDALALTRERTGFAERLIEKDYFCTALLEYLAATANKLVFKGGTCLAKVHVSCRPSRVFIGVFYFTLMV
jgi:predicted nucleotidyltransferase component of viral defense system